MSDIYIFAISWDQQFKRYKCYRTIFSSDGSKSGKLMGQSKELKKLHTYIPADYVRRDPTSDMLKTSSVKEFWFPNEQLADKVLLSTLEPAAPTEVTQELVEVLNGRG